MAVAAGVAAVVVLVPVFWWWLSHDRPWWLTNGYVHLEPYHVRTTTVSSDPGCCGGCGSGLPFSTTMPCVPPHPRILARRDDRARPSDLLLVDDNDHCRYRYHHHRRRRRLQWLLLDQTIQLDSTARQSRNYRAREVISRRCDGDYYSCGGGGFPGPEWYWYGCWFVAWRQHNRKWAKRNHCWHRYCCSC